MTNVKDFIAEELIGVINDRGADNEFRDEFAAAMELQRYQNQNFRQLMTIVEKAAAFYDIEDDDDKLIDLIEETNEMYFATWCLKNRGIKRELDEDTIEELMDLSEELEELVDEISVRRTRGRDSAAPRTRGRSRSKRRGAGGDALSSAAGSTRSFGAAGAPKERPKRARRSRDKDVPEMTSNAMSALVEASGAKLREGIDMLESEPYNHFTKGGYEYYLAIKSPWKLKDRPWSTWTDPRIEIPFHRKDEQGIIEEIKLKMDPKLEYERNRTMGADWARKSAANVSTQKARNPLMANVLPKETLDIGNDYTETFKSIYRDITNMTINIVSTKTIDEALTIARIKATGKEASVVRNIRDTFLIIKGNPVDTIEMGSTGVSACRYLNESDADVHQVAYYNAKLTERVNRIVYLLTGNANSIVSFKEHYIGLLEAISKAVEVGAIGQGVFESIIAAVNLEAIQVTTEQTSDVASATFIDLLSTANVDELTKERCANYKFSNPISVSLCGYMDSDHWEVFPGIESKPKIFKEAGFICETANGEVNAINRKLAELVEDGVNGGILIMEFRDGVRAMLEHVGGKIYLSKL